MRRDFDGTIPRMTAATARAWQAAEYLVADLREHGLDGDALDAAQRFAWLLRRLQGRGARLSEVIVDGVDDSHGSGRGGVLGASAVVHAPRAAGGGGAGPGVGRRGADARTRWRKRSATVDMTRLPGREARILAACCRS